MPDPFAEQYYQGVCIECGETDPCVLVPERFFSHTVDEVLYETDVTYQNNYFMVNAEVPTWKIVSLAPPSDRASLSSPTGFQAAFVNDGPASRPGNGASHPALLAILADNSPTRPYQIVAPEGLWVSVLQDSINPFTLWPEDDGGVRHLSDVKFSVRQGWYTNFDGLTEMPEGWMAIVVGTCGPPTLEEDEFRSNDTDVGSYMLNIGITPVDNPAGLGRMYARATVTSWSTGTTYHEAALILRGTLPSASLDGYVVFFKRDATYPSGVAAVYRFCGGLGTLIGAELEGGDAEIVAGDIIEAEIVDDAGGNPQITVKRNSNTIMVQTDGGIEKRVGTGVAGLGCKTAGALDLVGLKDFVWGSR